MLAREGFTRGEAEANYKTAYLMSCGPVRADWENYFNPEINAQSPVKTMTPTDSERAEIQSITFLPTDQDDLRVAQVRFDKTVTRGVAPPVRTRYISTLTVRYEQVQHPVADPGPARQRVRLLRAELPPRPGGRAAGAWAPPGAPAPPGVPAPSPAAAVSTTPGKRRHAIGCSQMNRAWCAPRMVLLLLSAGSTRAEVGTVPSAGDARIQTVKFTGDNIIRIAAAEGVVTTIELSKKEEIKDFAMGDRDAWHAAINGNLFVLKPKDVKADTNLTIFTNRRSLPVPAQDRPAALRAASRTGCGCSTPSRRPARRKPSHWPGRKPSAGR